MSGFGRHDIEGPGAGLQRSATDRGPANPPASLMPHSRSRSPEPVVLGSGRDLADHVHVIGSASRRRAGLGDPEVDGGAADERRPRRPADRETAGSSLELHRHSLVSNQTRGAQAPGEKVAGHSANSCIARPEAVEIGEQLAELGPILDRLGSSRVQRLDRLASHTAP